MKESNELLAVLAITTGIALPVIVVLGSPRSDTRPVIQLPAETPSESLVRAIIEVESGGDPDAIGQTGELGVLQIRPIMVDEVNRILGTERYTLADRRDPRKSVDMFWIYTDYWNDVRGDWTDQGMARRWNGGPTGHQEESTKAYWDQVQRAMGGQR